MGALRDKGVTFAGRPGLRGFTLVELLVVTVIIGVLAGMMIVSVGASVDSADATKLINDLRVIKAASLRYYMDNNAFPGDGLNSGQTFTASELEGYHDNPALMNAYGNMVYVKNSGKMFYGLKPDKPRALGPGALKKLEALGNIYDGDGNRFIAGGGYDDGPFYVIIK
ncbi:MAG: prepilin-type N-terminal cleavage/methylation domain-containing protein [Synergistaceae bacterium]|jgi:prepilin-type N-terminal cleavage/methylation domain-containing protein|nr:prepilin-type N-terminal cleavage/methylation domain-containing protein [Synergistaceae bacterium]